MECSKCLGDEVDSFYVKDIVEFVLGNSDWLFLMLS